jgi:hypothetical protein
MSKQAVLKISETDERALIWWLLQSCRTKLYLLILETLKKAENRT